MVEGEANRQRCLLHVKQASYLVNGGAEELQGKLAKNARIFQDG